MLLYRNYNSNSNIINQRIYKSTLILRQRKVIDKNLGI